MGIVYTSIMRLSMYNYIDILTNWLNRRIYKYTLKKFKDDKQEYVVHEFIDDGSGIVRLSFIAFYKLIRIYLPLILRIIWLLCHRSSFFEKG